MSSPSHQSWAVDYGVLLRLFADWDQALLLPHSQVKYLDVLEENCTVKGQNGSETQEESAQKLYVVLGFK